MSINKKIMMALLMGVMTSSAAVFAEEVEPLSEPTVEPTSDPTVWAGPGLRAPAWGVAWEGESEDVFNFYRDESKWIYQYGLGWLYPQGTAFDNVWFYFNSADTWFWTGNATYAWFYLNLTGDWGYLIPNTEADEDHYWWNEATGTFDEVP